MNGRTTPALTELRDLEGHIASQLWRFQQSGGRMDAAFVRALSELQSLLASGLDSVEPSRRKACRESDRLPLTVACASVSPKLRWASPRGERAAPPAAADVPAVDDFLVDYGEELASLEREARVSRDHAPLRLRMAGIRRRDDERGDLAAARG